MAFLVLSRPTPGCCNGPVFNNYGLVRKSRGAGTSSIGAMAGDPNLPFNNLGGTVAVDNGTLVLNGGGSSAGGTFSVAAGAVLDVTGGSGVTWSGLMTGSGAGQVQFNGGYINASALTVNFPDGLFQWNGGLWEGTVTNLGVVTISGT